MIHGMMIVRNEEGRWLEKALEQMKAICDRVVVIDDNSTDYTYEICLDFLREIDVLYRNAERKWHNKEYELRQQLWDITTAKASEGDIIVCFDADELITEKDITQFKKELEWLKSSEEADGIGYRLYDMWSNSHYRDDQYWRAHKGIWNFVIKYKPERFEGFKETGLHCGRFPQVKTPLNLAMSGVKVKHMGWSREEDRKKKYERYMRNDPNGEYGWLAQYESILDERPNLRRFE